MLLNFNHWKYGFYGNVGKSMLLNEVVYLRCLLQIYAPKFFKSWLYQPKKLQRLMTATPTKFYVNKCIHPRTMLLFVSNNICFKYAPKWMVSKLIFQKISEEEHRAPSPNQFPRFCSGFALSSGFAINSWALRTLWLRPRLSGASRPRFGLRPQLSISELGLTPKINTWIRQGWSAPPLANSLIGYW